MNYIHKYKKKTNNINGELMKDRIRFLIFLLYISFFVIVGRLYYLQIIKYDVYQEKLQTLTEKTILGDTAPRGRIYDRNGNLLVDNTLVRTIYYQKTGNLSVDEEVKLAYYIKDYLNIDYSKLTKSYMKDFYLMMNEDEINNRLTIEEKINFKERKLSDNEYYKLKKEKVRDEEIETYTDDDKKAIYIYYLMNNGYSYDSKVIKTNASEEEFAFFSESADKLLGFNTKYTYKRLYVYGETLKTVLGSVGMITSENKDYYLSKGYLLSDIVGLSNLEYVYDDYLKGEKEEYILSNDNKILSKEGKRGSDLYLTIDINLQKLVDETLSEEILKAKSAFNTKYFDRSYVTISNPNDGSILALSGKIYQDKKIYDYTIGTFIDAMTPGSVVKGASMLLGYQEGIVQIGQFMMDECIKLKATPKKCSIYNMGYINDLEALQRSSNVYQFKIALKVGGVVYRYDNPAYINDQAFSKYRHYFSLFGLGVKTGIELPKESQGYKGKNEDAGLLMNLAIGQYDTYTNIELNQYIATLANGKNRYQLHLLKKIQNEGNVLVEFEPKVLNTIEKIEDKYLDRVKKGLGLVMTNGTGYGYIDESLLPSGKTGTSETFVDSNLDGIYETESISTSFVGYFPSDYPEYAISISTPNISYVNESSSYIYPFNKTVIKKITDNMSVTS